MGKDTKRTHVVSLADVVAGVRRTVKIRRQLNRNERDGSRIEIHAVCNTRSCDRGENAGIAGSDSDRDTNAATADSGANEVRTEEEEYEGM